MAVKSLCFVPRYDQTAGELGIQEIIQNWSIKINYFMYQLINNLKQKTMASLPSGEMAEKTKITRKQL